MTSFLIFTTAEGLVYAWGKGDKGKMTNVHTYIIHIHLVWLVRPIPPPPPPPPILYG